MRVCLCLACVCLAHLLIELTFSGSPLFERVKKVSECSQSGCNLFESIWHQNSGAPCSTATTLPEDFKAQPRISGTADLPAQYALAKQRAAITATRWPRSSTQKASGGNGNPLPHSTWPSVLHCTNSTSPQPSFTPPIHKERFGPFAAQATLFCFPALVLLWYWQKANKGKKERGKY